MASKEYKAIFIPKDSHYKLKLWAIEKQMTIIELVEDLIKRKKIINNSK